MKYYGLGAGSPPAAAPQADVCGVSPSMVDALRVVQQQLATANARAARAIEIAKAMQRERYALAKENLELKARLSGKAPGPTAQPVQGVRAPPGVPPSRAEPMRGDSRPTPNNVVPIRGSPVIDVTPEEAGFPDVSADPFPMASPQQAQKLVDLGFGDTEDDVLNSFFNREK